MNYSIEALICGATIIITIALGTALVIEKYYLTTENIQLENEFAQRIIESNNAIEANAFGSSNCLKRIAVIKNEVRIVCA
ncbi:hypothetical protein HUU53_01990 [Candidatus Micrarchaeota archaeon]|nr:hypothetical protein [Candidatus Micrarchaeota archaeon]